jgi:phosphoribosyl 1,2-cyclic phosphate phosphodiesterase
MELRFLGTAAAEGVPAMYCRCQACMTARKRGGKDIRTRSSFRIGSRYQIDLGPDANWQMHRLGIDMYDVEHLFITHTHDDHFQLEEIVAKTMSFGFGANGKPLDIYVSLPGWQWLNKLLPVLYERQRYENPTFAEQFRVHALAYFQIYPFGELLVETLKGGHVVRGGRERAMQYLMHLPDGRRLLYALDTGWFPDETWEFLQQKHIDILILDCTFGVRTDRPTYPEGHLDIASFVKALERMTAIGAIDTTTRIFATHISSHQGALHEEMQAHFDETSFPVTVAYDGCII